MESIMDDGYLFTENIIVLKQQDDTLTVKEGNRRIAALKFILGYLNPVDYGVPTQITDRITALPPEWIQQNSHVPCAVYNITEENLVDKIVALTHGKGEGAAREKWTSVARARHNRDLANTPEPILDLLEKYLANGNNLNNQQKESWAGEYPLTVLWRRLSERYCPASVLQLPTIW